MKPEQFHALFTMNCLPPNGPRMIRGPLDYDDARRNMMSFAEVMASERLRGTFFIAPEGLKHMADTARELAAAGMELGVLSHPQLSSYQSYLGCYGYEREREIIHMHKQLWEDRLGEPAVNFRAGFFSASDYTFQILCVEGFRQTSCSLPGRVDPEQCSLWQKAFPFPHHTDPLDRRLKGTMELYEAPVTSQFGAREHVRAETFTPPHLRIEEPQINDYAEGLIEGCLRQMGEERVAVRSVTFVTENWIGWGGAEDPLTERLRNLAGLLRMLADRLDMTLVASDLAALHAAEDVHWRTSGEAVA